MRVVQLTCSDGFGGVEQYLVNLARGLAERDIDVAVIGGAENAMRRGIGGTVPWLPGDTIAQAAASLRSLGGVDLLNTHMSQADFVGWGARMHRPRLRQVSTRHFAAPRGRNRALRVASHIVASGISAQIAISEFVASHVEGECLVVHSGVATAEAGGQRERVVLVVQRLEPEKDTHTAIRAWASSSARDRGWTLRVVGSGSQRSELEGNARALGVDGSVEFAGFSDEVPKLLASAGAVIAPTPREGLGILVLEAMAAATPVLAAAGGGHLETVGAATPELLFAPGDVSAAARLLDLVTAKAELRQAAGAALQRVQREHFTIAGQVEGTLGLYREVLSR